MPALEMETVRREARAAWRKQIVRSALLALLLAWAFHSLSRPSVESSSRWGWLIFFSILAVAQAARTLLAWRRLRGVLRGNGQSPSGDC